MIPPKAEKIRKELPGPDGIRIDNYFWLNQRDDPKVIEYLNAENGYTDKVMKHTVPVQEKIYNEMLGRIKQDDSSVPYKDNGYFYYTRYEENNEYPVYCRKKESLDAQEEILLNVNELAFGHKYFNVTGVSVSNDNKFLSFGVDTLSRRMYSICIKNLVTGEMLEGNIQNTTGYAIWANDNKTLFYTSKNNALRAYKIFRHTLGEIPAEDIEVYHEVDETFSCMVFKTKSKAYLLIGSFSSLWTEYRVLHADNPYGNFEIFQPRERNHEYSIEHLGDRFFVKTNLNAKNFRLMETPVSRTNKENWTEIISHRNDVLLEEIEIFNDFIVLMEKKNGLDHLRILGLNDKSDHYLEFGEAAYAAYFDRNPSFDSDLFRYSYSSLTTPGSVIDYNMRTKEKIILKQDEVLGGYNKENYLIERLFAPAEDGTKIPISLVYRKGIMKDGSNPLLLYGYGSYAISTEPVFSSTRLSLLDRGFIYAIAHIRGGQEMGRYWYEEGKLLKKKNTFSDFINCAEYLIREKYSSIGKLCAMGGSAGGLLIGAAVNMRPGLFKAVAAIVPFVDVVTTMQDDSLPLTAGEFDEWGNPAIKEFFDYILSYSPYDNVERKNYPAMLVMTGLYDSQVQYWEPAKWVAKLRDLKTDNNILLLKINMEAGHGGASGRFQKLKETALIYAFFFDQLNIKEK
jgi:oligopeptidase B